MNWGLSKFIWGKSLRRDNMILFRYTACAQGMQYPVVTGQYLAIYTKLENQWDTISRQAVVTTS